MGRRSLATTHSASYHNVREKVFITLIFGRWRPLGAFGAALLFSTTVGIQRVIRFAPPEGGLAIAVFRIFQETLTNVIRHAGAETASVLIERQDAITWVSDSQDGDALGVFAQRYDGAGQPFTAALLDWLRNLQGAEPQALACLAALPPTYPLPYELALAGTGAPLGPALQAYAFGWAENMTQAALKAVPLGQSSGQRMLAVLARAIPGAVHIALSHSDDSRQAFSPMLAILSSRHETQYSRLFRS